TEVDEAISWLASAQWKTKQDKSRMTTLLPAFVYVMIERSPELAYRTLEIYNRKGPEPLAGRTFRMYEELCARFGQKPSAEAPPAPKPPDRDEIMRGLMERLLSSPNTRIDGDALIVTGVRDSYVIHIKEFRIVRRSDGRLVRLEIDWSKPLFSPFRAMLDGMDLQDPFRPNYFRILLCAQILSLDYQNEAVIIVDDQVSTPGVEE